MPCPRAALVASGGRLATNPACMPAPNMSQELCWGVQELVLETDKLGASFHNDHPLSQSDDSIWKVYFQVSSFM